MSSPCQANSNHSPCESMADRKDDTTHRPVMLAAVLEALNISPDAAYMDLTYGRGGHARAILERLGPRGRLIAMDRDPEAVQAAQRELSTEPRFAVRHGSFDEAAAVAKQMGVVGAVCGILLDLGVSSPQLDDPRRGFSFRRDGPLDMRMDPTTGESAAAWLAQVSERELIRVLRDYGEERFAARIGRAIIAARSEQPIETTGQLRSIVAAANPSWEAGKDPATRTFQAIRIHVNRELEVLRGALPHLVDVLAPGGRLVVIGFHSLEDRIVKRFIRRQARGDDYPPGLPVTEAMRRPRLRAIGAAQHPGAEEIADNPRARSAVLRVAEKIQ